MDDVLFRYVDESGRATMQFAVGDGAKNGLVRWWTFVGSSDRR
jgi:hypothetical protein